MEGRLERGLVSAGGAGICDGEGVMSVDETTVPEVVLINDGSFSQ